MSLDFSAIRRVRACPASRRSWSQRVLGACFVAAFAAPAWADRPLGLDVSVYTPLTTTEWTSIRNSGRVFGFARASYGWGGTDTQFVNHMTHGKAAGLYMGAYHFEYAGYDSNHTPINEANTFLSVARNYITAGYLRPVLDVEYIGPSMGGLTLSQWCNQWMNYVTQQTGVEPLIYCNLNYAQNYLDSTVKTRDLWIAAWWTNPDPQTENPNTDGWATWRFWQYAGDVTIPGVTNQKVDLNVFNGTLTGLQAYVIGGPQPPTITQHPANQNVCPGATATFTVAAVGTGTLSYQWQKNGSNVTNGGHYSGCTTTTLTVSSAASGDAATYRCVVSNGNGSTTSNNAALPLRASTVVTQQPQSQTAALFGTATFTVVASGDGSLGYQWRRYGVDMNDDGRIFGTATSTLTITHVNTGDVAVYNCAVTAGCGATVSTFASLTLDGVPGDFDGDGDVDLDDFGAFQNCL